MRRSSAAEDIGFAGEFGSRVAKLVAQLDETRGAVIMQDGAPTAVAATPDELDQITHEELIREKIREGLESLAREPTISPEDAKKRAFAAIARVAKQ